MYLSHSPVLYCSSIIIIVFLLSIPQKACVAYSTIQYQHLLGVPSGRWPQLSKKKIFLGHQSVGTYIISGINSVLPQFSNLNFNIHKIDKNTFKTVTPSFFPHIAFGESMNPSSKIDDFVSLMNNGLATQTDIAFFKFCYVDIDIDKNTNIKKLFLSYKSAMTKLAQQYPETTFLHVTTPLTSQLSLF